MLIYIWSSQVKQRTWHCLLLQQTSDCSCNSCSHLMQKYMKPNSCRTRCTLQVNLTLRFYINNGRLIKNQLIIVTYFTDLFMPVISGYLWILCFQHWNQSWNSTTSLPCTFRLEAIVSSTLHAADGCLWFLGTSGSCAFNIGTTTFALLLQTRSLCKQYAACSR